MNIIFDGNYLFHKTLGVFKSMKESEAKQDLNMKEVFEDKESQAQFFRKVIIDCCSTIRLFDNVEKVLFVFDNPSWRRDKYDFYKFKEKDEFQLMLDEEEKPGWDIFYGLMDKIVKHLSKAGFPVSKILDFEGDDLCFFFATYYSVMNETSVIISGDKDLLQFIDFNTAVYRNNSMAPAFFCCVDSKLWKAGKQIKAKFDKTDLAVIDPTKHTFVKMLMGDKGDGVPNLFKGLGIKTAEKIYELALKHDLCYLDYSNDHYIDCILEVIKIVCPKSPDLETLKKQLLINVNVMWLDTSVYTIEQLQVAENEVFEKADSYTYQGEFNLTDILNAK